MQPAVLYLTENSGLCIATQPIIIANRTDVNEEFYFCS
ncbi:Uncharacterised protein [Corynebacterium minutissimum]|uniref:Uncharacterized protein n=1 Tax=Corynebacterium minutissimum TaxID=38301 RepID=A0A2X4RIT7_9CORY|nr:Uncharacterised protein [Corynebacterium minutissimum]VEG06661.1 Uncharacterised protein [Corynebacterium minutissimum]